jgi:hypothetical protein
LSDPEAVRIASDFLKQHHLPVEAPILTQAYQVDLDDDGVPEKILCAHNDKKAVRDNEPADIYAIALLQTEAPGHEKTMELASQISHKPAGRTMEEHQRYYGTRDFYRLIMVYDLVGDGRKEIGLYRAKEDAAEADVFTFDGRNVKQVLSAYKPYYN